MRAILIANRGEIACRIIRSVQHLGLRAIAVYSEADKDAPHVALADAALCIGEGAAAESYLNAKKLLAAAKESGAEAIHPGYGFLSENAAFVEAVEKTGLVFIGPSANAMAAMGDKAAAKKQMREAGVPCVPGYDGDDQSETVLLREAEKIGFSVMIKASAGGGGKGMRVAAKKDDLVAAVRLAKSEAENAFGDGRLILEKALTGARHVEIQILADAKGNVIHLGERDCSVQRRHQKLIEEAPAPDMTIELREEMGKAAILAAKTIDYRNAGTVEFLLTGAGEFYFLEMNTRLQVEHPVTEMITGLDLVALQIEIAKTGALPLTQKQVDFSGHAIEARLCTEDPGNDFLPGGGKIEIWQGATTEGIRLDDGIAQGQEITGFYDPMAAKLIAHGKTRAEARLKLLRGLEETLLFGPPSNRDFLMACLAHDDFAAGGVGNDFITRAFPTAPVLPRQPDPIHLAAAALLQFFHARESLFTQTLAISEENKNWSSSASIARKVNYLYAFANDAGEMQEFPVALTYGDAPNAYRVFVGDEEISLCLNHVAPAQEGRASEARIDVESSQWSGKNQKAFFYAPSLGELFLSFRKRQFFFRNGLSFAGTMEEEMAKGSLAAPMHGKLLEVFVKEGEAVSAGKVLAIMEAMKMQHEIKSPANGKVKSLIAAEGAQLAAGDPILELEID